MLATLTPFTATFCDAPQLLTALFQRLFSNGSSPPQVTHLNFYWNDIARIEGLGGFPNLMRLTLKGNHLTSMQVGATG